MHGNTPRWAYTLLFLLCITVTDVHASGQNTDSLFTRWAGTPDTTLLWRGRDYLYKNKIHEALVAYSIVANKRYNSRLSYEETENIARAMNNIGYIYFYYYFDYQKSYQYLHEAEKIATDNHLTSNRSYISLNLGNLYLTLSDLHKDDKYFSRLPMKSYTDAFHFACDAKEWNILQIIYCNLLQYSVSSGQLDSIADIRRKYRTMKFPQGTLLVKFNHLQERAISAYIKKDFSEALRLIDQAIAAIDIRDTPERYAFAQLQFKAEIFTLQDDREGVQSAFAKMRDILRKNRLEDLATEFYQTQATYYRHIGLRDSADRYEIEYLKAKDRLANDLHLNMAAEMHFMTELQESNAKVRLLDMKRRMSYIIIFLCIVAITSAAGYIYTIRRKNRDLRRQQQALYDNMQAILRKEEKTETKTETKTAAKYQNSKLDEEEKQRIAQQIHIVMADTATICSPDFSLTQLSQTIDVPYAEVSHVINEVEGKNFNALLGEFRVREACRRLGDTEKYGHLTIEAISSSVGFKSRTNFVAIFKRVTGLTPSEYQRTARLQNDRK